MKMDGTIHRLHLVPPAATACQVCAAAHAPDEPHNAESLYYQMQFYDEHGRWATWADALAHCSPAVRAAWTAELTSLGVPVTAFS